MDPAPLSFLSRLWFAWVCFFRVLFDGAFAGRAFAVRDAMPALPPPPPIEPKAETKAETKVDAIAPARSDDDAAATDAAADDEAEEVGRTVRVKVKKRRPELDTLADAPQSKRRGTPDGMPAVKDVTPALQLLAALQREGRLVDFLEQDVATFSDADVGAAARVVHEGCRKALRQHAKIEAVRGEEEGSSVTIPEGYDAKALKLIGDVRGAPPYKGKLQHRGWRVIDLRVPEPTKDHDATVIAPAEVEL